MIPIPQKCAHLMSRIMRIQCAMIVSMVYGFTMSRSRTFGMRMNDDLRPGECWASPSLVGMLFHGFIGMSALIGMRWSGVVTDDEDETR